VLKLRVNNYETEISATFPDILKLFVLLFRTVYQIKNSSQDKANLRIIYALLKNDRYFLAKIYPYQ
jgi:hypothetical protein